MVKVREAVPLVKVICNKCVDQRPYTMVELQWQGLDDTIHTSYGFARCNWRDRWDRELGVTIARNRAVFDAAAQIAASA